MTTSPDRYISTRGDAAPTRFSDALLRGIAPDGGLYMPQAWPSLPADATRPGRGYAEIAKAAMAPFIALPDLGVFLPLFAAILLASFAAHRLVRRVAALRALAPDWVSWTSRQFPMGLALGGSLIAYLALVAVNGF